LDTSTIDKQAEEPFSGNVFNRRNFCKKEPIMAEPARWSHMATAPRDGSRVLVTVRAAEQGPADIDVAYWARADKSGMEGWRAIDSSPGCVVFYAEPELKCWMPLPSAGLVWPAPASWKGDEKELFGSGI
jgi:hypothetical protein